jgi:hypothetical protein
MPWPWAMDSGQTGGVSLRKGPRPDQVDLRQGSQPPSPPCDAGVSGHRMTGSEDDLVGSASVKTRPVLPVARLRRKRDGAWVLGAGCWSGAVPVKWQSWSDPSKHYAFCLRKASVIHSFKIPKFHNNKPHVPRAIMVSAADLDPAFSTFCLAFVARNNESQDRF